MLPNPDAANMIARLLSLPEDSLAHANKPKTLDDLKGRLGDLGEAAAERAEWGAVVRWINARQEAKLDPAKTKQLAQSVCYYMDALAASAGFPSIMGRPLTADFLDFHRSRQSRIKKAAIAIKDDWQKAGRQWLKPSISYIWDYLQTAEKNTLRRD